MKPRINVICACAAAVVLFFILFDSRGPEKVWEIWNVPPMTPHFADLRVITHGAESYAAGYDPMLENPADPWGRPLNYPRIWQLLYPLGVSEQHTTFLGFLLIAGFLVGVCLVFPNADNRTMALLFATLLSPVVLIGAERANIDLLMFLLVSASIWSAPRSPAVSGLLILGGFMLKLFPVFAWAHLLKTESTKLMKLTLAALVIGGVYLFGTLEDIFFINEITPKGPFLSYGTGVYAKALSEVDGMLGFYTLVVSRILLPLVLVAALFGLRQPGIAQENPKNIFSLDAFRAGAAIYVGTFLLGHNWDYRLIFLLFTLPQLLLWSAEARPVGLFAKLTMAAILISFWHMVIVKWFRPVHEGYLIALTLDELCNWFVFGSLAWLLCRSAPDSIKALTFKSSTR